MKLKWNDCVQRLRDGALPLDILGIGYKHVDKLPWMVCRAMTNGVDPRGLRVELVSEPVGGWIWQTRYHWSVRVPVTQGKEPTTVETFGKFIKNINGKWKKDCGPANEGHEYQDELLKDLNSIPLIKFVFGDLSND